MPNGKGKGDGECGLQFLRSGGGGPHWENSCDTDFNKRGKGVKSWGHLHSCSCGRARSPAGTEHKDREEQDRRGREESKSCTDLQVSVKMLTFTMSHYRVLSRSDLYFK